jgi:hypothetical protein
MPEPMLEIVQKPEIGVLVTCETSPNRPSVDTLNSPFVMLRTPRRPVRTAVRFLNVYLSIASNSPSPLETARAKMNAQ